MVPQHLLVRCRQAAACWHSQPSSAHRRQHQDLLHGFLPLILGVQLVQRLDGDKLAGVLVATKIGDPVVACSMRVSVVGERATSAASNA
jgi:hypothetical protein